MDAGEPSTGSSSSTGGGGGGGNWTNEMHFNFLNSMEATFVRTMLIENNSSSFHHHNHLRLDRYLPDSLESTLDSATSQRAKKSPIAASADSVGSRSKMGSGRAERKRSRRSTISSSQARTQHIQNSNGTHDQVVPQLGKRSGDKDERDPRRG